jgi:signal transduction histidine kinase
MSKNRELWFMMWFKTSYKTYPLVILALIATIALQAAWLYQLFESQKQQLGRQIDEMVNDQAKKNLYLSLVSLRDIGNERQMKSFFLSPQWQQIRIAYDNMNVYGLDANFTIKLDGDTTHVNMDFKVSDSPPKVKREVAPELIGLTPEAVLKKDTVALPRMIGSVARQLIQMGVSAAPHYRITTFVSGKQVASTLPATKQAAYYSAKYSYNFKHHYQYQLVLISLDRDVLYKMRYHLISASLMVLLTGLAFYYLLSLYRKQKLYTDAKIDFTNNMTHEFKTPIVTAGIAFESIGKYGLANDPDKLKNYIDIGRFELQRLNLMVEKVLKINQQETQEERMNLQLYEVQTELAQVASAMKLQMAKTGSSIEIIETVEPYFVFADPIHLSNVFYNLIDNAIKYGIKPISVVISFKQVSDKVIISMKDNGPGIAEVYQEAIFDRFFRIPAEGDIHRVKGSGLGLYYVRQTIESHKGTIRVDSTLGKGANFIITLPVAS